MLSIPQIVLPDQFNAVSAFLDHNLQDGRGTRPALHFQGQTYTYAQIAELANRVGNGLRDLGLEMEQRVALLLLDSPEWAAAFFGGMKIGAVPVALNTSLRPADYIYMLNDSRAKVLLISAEVWPVVQGILPELKYLRHIVVVGLIRAGQVESATLHDFENWVAKASTHLETVETSKDDSAFWAYSSGSTGFPKGCVHLHHDMSYCTEYYAKNILNMQENDITFSAAKLYFSYGLGNNLYFPFGVGASAVHYPGRPLAEDMFKVIQESRPTIFFGVPTLYANMLALPDGEKRFDFSSVRVCVSAGESLPGELLRRWQDKFHVDILDGIGSTEILHIFISNRPGEIRPGSTGKLVPGYEALIADEHGHAVPQGEIGNLLIRGDSIISQY
ncbi:MAG: benzoate-CoA ligase family protein, partial [Ktedonobacteraceae bacterium]